jgi:uncharacterized membrane protein
MAVWLDVARVAAAVNILLLLALSSVWVRNYLQFRSKHPLALSLFGGLLVVENAVALYVFSLDPVLSAWIASSDPVAQWAMMALRLLELGALLVLAWATWD